MASASIIARQILGIVENVGVLYEGEAIIYLIVMAHSLATCCHVLVLLLPAFINSCCCLCTEFDAHRRLSSSFCYYLLLTQNVSFVLHATFITAIPNCFHIGSVSWSVSRSPRPDRHLVRLSPLLIARLLAPSLVALLFAPRLFRAPQQHHKAGLLVSRADLKAGLPSEPSRLYSLQLFRKKGIKPSILFFSRCTDTKVTATMKEWIVMPAALCQGYTTATMVFERKTNKVTLTSTATLSIICHGRNEAR